MEFGFSLAFHKLITTLTPPFVIKQKDKTDKKKKNEKLKKWSRVEFQCSQGGYNYTN